MAQLSFSFATHCKTKCYFSRAGQGREQLIPLKSWVYSIKITFERRQCIPNMRFVKKLILAHICLFGVYEGRDFTIYLKYRAKLGVRFRPSG